MVFYVYEYLRFFVVFFGGGGIFTSGVANQKQKIWRPF